MALPKTVKYTVTHQGQALRRGQITWQMFEQAADDDHPVVDHIRPVDLFDLACDVLQHREKRDKPDGPGFGQKFQRHHLDRLTNVLGKGLAEPMSRIFDQRLLLATRFFRHIQTIFDLLAGAEERHPFFLDEHRVAVEGIAPRACGTMPYDKGAKTPDFDALSPFEGAGDFIENGLDGILRIATMEVWISRGKEINKLGFNHDRLFSENEAFGKPVGPSQRQTVRGSARPRYRGVRRSGPRLMEVISCGEFVRLHITARRFSQRLLNLSQRMALFRQFIRECKGATLP